MNGITSFLLKLGTGALILYAYRKLTGIKPEAVMETIAKGVEIITEIDESITIVMDGQAQNFQGNNDAIDAMEARGLTGLNKWHAYEKVRDGIIPDFFGVFDPPLKPAQRFLSKARQLAGNPRWSIFQNWLTDQANIYIAFYDNQ